MLMSETMKGVEVIVGAGGRRYWSAAEKLRGVEESLTPGESMLLWCEETEGGQ